MRCPVLTYDVWCYEAELLPEARRLQRPGMTALATLSATIGCRSSYPVWYTCSVPVKPALCHLRY
eukprot:465519-Rhodomonas_salina.2